MDADRLRTGGPLREPDRSTARPRSRPRPGSAHWSGGVTHGGSRHRQPPASRAGRSAGAETARISTRRGFFGSFARLPSVPRECLYAICRRTVLELVATPRELFAKLDEWGSEFLVIPHGTAWGYNTPPGASWNNQLIGSAQHDSERQTMIELFSGHGSSEEYRPLAVQRGRRERAPVLSGALRRLSPLVLASGRDHPVALRGSGRARLRGARDRGSPELRRRRPPGLEDRARHADRGVARLGAMHGLLSARVQLPPGHLGAEPHGADRLRGCRTSAALPLWLYRLERQPHRATGHGVQGAQSARNDRGRRRWKAWGPGSAGAGLTIAPGPGQKRPEEGILAAHRTRACKLVLSHGRARGRALGRAEPGGIVGGAAPKRGVRDERAAHLALVRLAHRIGRRCVERTADGQRDRSQRDAEISRARRRIPGAEAGLSPITPWLRSVPSDWNTCVERSVTTLETGGNGSTASRLSAFVPRPCRTNPWTS